MSPAGTERAQRGYTLVELLVVLAVGVLLLSALPAAYGAAFPSVRAKAAAQDIASALKTVRAEAIASQEAKTVVVAGGAVRRATKGSQPLFQAEESLQLWVQPLQPGSGATDEESITFYEDGTASGGVIYLGSGARTYRVGVDWLTGNIMVEL